MITYLIKRLLFAIPVLLVTAVLVFSALHLAGGDPVMLLVHPTAPQETRDAVRAKLGLDQPLPVQFVTCSRSMIRSTSSGSNFPLRQTVFAPSARSLPPRRWRWVHRE